jgi:hypothetical protein
LPHAGCPGANTPERIFVAVDGPVVKAHRIFRLIDAFPVKAFFCELI